MCRPTYLDVPEIRSATESENKEAGGQETGGPKVAESKPGKVIVVELPLKKKKKKKKKTSWEKVKAVFKSYLRIKKKSGSVGSG
jgi:hypothetical protein